MKRLAFLGSVVCLLASGCEDSKNPLSDPQTSKADERLMGVWRGENEGHETYYHVGHTGKEFPSGVMRVVRIDHRNGRVTSPQVFFVFATAIGGEIYLNVALDRDENSARRRDQKGWKAVEADNYKFFKYRLDGEKLVMWMVNEEAKRKAIKGGKVKGEGETSKFCRFIDTTENVARFVAGTGDSLWVMKYPLQFERVVDRRRCRLLFPEEVERAMIGEGKFQSKEAAGAKRGFMPVTPR
jgi:hypothetical protein